MKEWLCSESTRTAAECVAVVPDMWEYEQGEDEVIIIGDGEGNARKRQQFVK